MYRVELCTELFYAIILTLSPWFLLICYLYILLHFKIVIIVMVMCGLQISYAGAVVLSSVSDRGSGPIFLDQLDCNGTENTLLECNAFTGRGLSTCDHSQDVGVLCRGRYCMAAKYYHHLVISCHMIQYELTVSFIVSW